MAIPVADNFNRANGGLGANWSTITSRSAPQIVGNLVEASAVGAATDSAARWSADAFNADQFAQIAITTINTDVNKAVGLVVRAASAAQTYYKLTAKGPIALSLVELVKTVAGVNTTLASGTEVFATGDLLRLAVTGSALVASKNGTPILQTIDSGIATGNPGIYLFDGTGSLSDSQLDNFTADNVASTVHTVSGSGSFAVASPSFLKTSITGRPSIVTSGAANPPNWYHVGMLSWGTANGVLTAYPVTRDLDLVQLPAGMNIVYYEFVSGVTAVITELGGP